MIPVTEPDAVREDALPPFPWWRMAGLALLAYGLFLLLWLPAALPWGLIERQWPEASLDTRGATLWTGESRSLRVMDEALSASWRFDPMALFAARLGYRTRLNGDGLAWTGRVAWRSEDDVRLTEAQAEIALARLPDWLKLPLPPMFTPLHGEAALSAATLEMRQGWPTRLEGGRLALRDVSLEALALGD